MERKHDHKKIIAQTHVHEFLGSVMNPKEDVEPHNHRFAGISSEEIPVNGGHVHEILTNIDFYEGHLHELGVRTGLQIPVGNNRHVHFAEGTTTFNANHTHNYQFATLIDDPIGE
ncbi:MAG: hypothetical protein GX764_07995 [Firmicutes bacterium]|jgi:hypothetical protein|nr:hypothetical protein [Bacillota bacterium]